MYSLAHPSCFLAIYTGTALKSSTRTKYDGPPQDLPQWEVLDSKLSQMLNSSVDESHAPHQNVRIEFVHFSVGHDNQNSQNRLSTITAANDLSEPALFKSIETKVPPKAAITPE